MLEMKGIGVISIEGRQNNHHAFSTAPPYCAGSSLSSMSGRSSFPIVLGPWPTTFILAIVAGDKTGLKSQKIHVISEGTFTKNLCAWYYTYGQNYIGTGK